MTKKTPLTDAELRALIKDRARDPIPENPKKVDPDFLSNPENSDRHHIRKRERQINQAQKDLGIDLT
ncbi:MAG: hypothetical protein ACPGNV_05185 [Mangrovicoccus sp.]